MSISDEQLAFNAPDSFSASPIRRAAGPLRLIFWGIIICLVKIQLNRFDIINDFVGMLLILWGIVLLSRIPPFVLYRRRMLFLVVLTAITTVCTLFSVILFPF